jgi:hypothetical protein
LQLRLPLRRKLPKLRIVLQSAALLLRRQILVVAQPISGMTRLVAWGLVALRLLAGTPSTWLRVLLLGAWSGSRPA